MKTGTADLNTKISTNDGTDLQVIYNDAYFFVFSQLINTDLNGDDFVYAGDYLLADNDAVNFVSLIRS